MKGRLIYVNNQIEVVYIAFNRLNADVQIVNTILKN